MSRTKRKSNKIPVFTALVLIIIVTMFFVFRMLGDNSNFIFSNKDTQEVKETIAQTTQTTATLYAVGDNIPHQSVIDDGLKSDGTYDYMKFYDNIKNDIKNADIAFVNQESPIGGDNLGVTGYPSFNAPVAIAKNLSDLGFDVVNHANNHLMDKGRNGLVGTLDTWENYPNVNILGLYESQEQRDKPVMVSSNNIKFAFLSYTLNLNGLSLPNDMPYATNLIDKELIKKDVLNAKKQSDFVVVSMHWGYEYTFKPSDEQRELAQYLSDLGVDLIIGEHPHVIQPVQWVTGKSGNKTLVIYSLGNLVHSQEQIETLLELSANITFVKDEEKGNYIKSAIIEPLVDHYEVGKKDFKIYKLDDYSDELASRHGIVKFQNKVPLTLDYLYKTYNNVIDNSNLTNDVISPSNTDNNVQENISTVSKNNDWKLILVNRDNFLPDDYNVDLISINDNYDVPAKAGSKVDKKVIDPLISMINDAKKDGINLYVRSTYRPISLQQTYYDANYNSFINQGFSPDEARAKTEEYYAIPGKSEHHTGLAIDIVSTDWKTSELTADFDKTASYEWLSKNAHNYGFILRYPKDKEDITKINYEPWHYRFVGKENAKEIYEKGICLEEYVLNK